MLPITERRRLHNLRVAATFRALHIVGALSGYHIFTVKMSQTYILNSRFELPLFYLPRQYKG